MDVAALLLTGGASRRMGSDKASLPGRDGRPLALRTGTLLTGLGGPAVEVGGHSSGLDAAVADRQPGAGPLAAVADGVAALRAAGWVGPALVVATDLPLLERAVVVGLARHPAAASVVPMVGGRAQWLCARYDAGALDGAAAHVAAGRRDVRALAEGCPVTFVDESDWPGLAAALVDADTPEDLAALGLSVPAEHRP